MMTRTEFEARLQETAKGWVGVGFLHNGRTKSQGVDCLGLIACVFREVGLDVPDSDGNTYRSDWYMHAQGETYLTNLLIHSVPILPKEALAALAGIEGSVRLDSERGQFRPGDVLYFRPGVLRPGGSDRITHGGIYLGNNEMIHALNERPVEIASLRLRAWVISYAGAVRPKAVLAALGEAAP